MKKIPLYLLTVLAAWATMASSDALALDINLPAETAAYRASTLPGYVLAQQHCMTCHSAQYVQTQPSTSPRTYWDATVKKMKKPFGAQIPDQDIPVIVDYLVKTYGAERDAQTSAK
jgi:cytochrome c5